MRVVWLLLAALLAAGAEAATPPHLGSAGQNEFRDYADAPDHRAFAIAPGGAWGWSAGKSTTDAAEDEALSVCQGQTEQRCVLYAVDQRTVFDAAGWSKLWRPYASAAQAAKATTGRARGQRMYDLSFTDARGKMTKVSALRGKVVVLHFWGSWCPPCRREMPEIQRLYQRLAKRGDIEFVILQARERFAVARQWAAQHKIDLPLADSGSSGDEDSELALAAGGKIKDREISNRFPTTYVLDRHGIVVFSHVGPIDDWAQYELFIQDVAIQKP